MPSRIITASIRTATACSWSDPTWFRKDERESGAPFLADFARSGGSLRVVLLASADRLSMPTAVANRRRRYLPGQRALQNALYVRVRMRSHILSRLYMPGHGMLKDNGSELTQTQPRPTRKTGAPSQGRLRKRMIPTSSFGWSTTSAVFSKSTTIVAPSSIRIPDLRLQDSPDRNRLKRALGSLSDRAQYPLPTFSSSCLFVLYPAEAATGENTQ